MSGVEEVKKMVVEAMEGASDVHYGLAADGAGVASKPSAGARRIESAEDRWAEVVLRVIRTNGKVQNAIMDLVLSSPYIQWEL